MSTFIHGMLAAKAKIANQLVAEILDGMPDDLLAAHQAALSHGAVALRDIHDALRTRTPSEAVVTAPRSTRIEDAIIIGARGFNCLDNAGVHTLSDLTTWRRKDLLRLKNLGATTIREVENALATFGLSLRPDTCPRSPNVPAFRQR